MFFFFLIYKFVRERSKQKRDQFFADLIDYFSPEHYTPNAVYRPLFRARWRTNPTNARGQGGINGSTVVFVFHFRLGTRLGNNGYVIRPLRTVITVTENYVQLRRVRHFSVPRAE